MTKTTELGLPGTRIHDDGTVPPPRLRTRWAWVVGTVFGVGWMKPGPGTWASLAAAAVWYVALKAAHLTGEMAALATLVGALGAVLAGIPAATVVERESGLTDPGFVVIDEVAGQWITLAIAPIDAGHTLLGFVLFRLFDIVKPWPVRRLERLHGGTGIMLDDAGAGVYGLLVMLVIRQLFAGSW